MTLTVYSFEDADGNEVTSFTTMNPNEARRFGVKNACRVIAQEFEYADSEVAFDFTKPDPDDESEEAWDETADARR